MTIAATLQPRRGRAPSTALAAALGLLLGALSFLLGALGFAADARADGDATYAAPPRSLSSGGGLGVAVGVPTFATHRCVVRAETEDAARAARAKAEEPVEIVVVPSSQSLPPLTIDLVDYQTFCYFTMNAAQGGAKCYDRNYDICYTSTETALAFNKHFNYLSVGIEEIEQPECRRYTNTLLRSIALSVVSRYDEKRAGPVMARITRLMNDEGVDRSGPFTPLQRKDLSDLSIGFKLIRGFFCSSTLSSLRGAEARMQYTGQTIGSVISESASGTCALSEERYCGELKKLSCHLDLAIAANKLPQTQAEFEAAIAECGPI